jgi:P27 family predicted phage terminase small subunit
MAGNGMSGGANRKPTVMKIIEGTYRADRVAPNEPKPEVVNIPPPMPDGLNEYGQREWEKMTLELTKIGILTTIDSSQLAAYCNEIGNYWECEKARKEVYATGGSDEELEAAAMFYKNYFDMAQKHLKQARDIAIQFGFTPASRTRISVPKKENENPLDSL